MRNCINLSGVINEKSGSCEGVWLSFLLETRPLWTQMSLEQARAHSSEATPAQNIPVRHERTPGHKCSRSNLKQHAGDSVCNDGHGTSGKRVKPSWTTSMPAFNTQHKKRYSEECSGCSFAVNAESGSGRFVNESFTLVSGTGSDFQKLLWARVMVKNSFHTRLLKTLSHTEYFYDLFYVLSEAWETDDHSYFSVTVYYI